MKAKNKTPTLEDLREQMARLEGKPPASPRTREKRPFSKRYSIQKLFMFDQETVDALASLARSQKTSEATVIRQLILKAMKSNNV